MVVAADAVVAWMPGCDSLAGVFSSPNSLAEVVAGSMVTGFVAKWGWFIFSDPWPFYRPDLANVLRGTFWNFL